MSFLYYVIGFLCSLGLTLFIMPKLIQFLHKIKFGQTEREEGLESHKSKSGTPTMGGIAFIFVPVLLYVLFSIFHLVPFHLYTLIIVLAFVGYGLIGFIDDFLIVVKKNNDGLKPKMKFLLQSILAVVFFLLYQYSGAPMNLWIPLIDVSVPLGVFYFLLIFIMFTAETNAVNLTDGVDGLCAGQMIIALVPFFFFALHSNNDGVAFLICLLIGSLLGYLKYNKHPAKIFMGDTGSLALGGFIAAVAMVLKQEVLLILIGGVFVAEVLSVMIQVTYFRHTRGKRIFRMAPLHHHYEKGGLTEVQVVRRFWMAGVVLAVLGYVIGVI